jgi:adenylate kinase
MTFYLPNPVLHETGAEIDEFVDALAPDPPPAVRRRPPVRIALLGPPGSGKGTQGAALARHLGIPLISSGALLRAVTAAAPAEWGAIKAALDRGDLVPDDDVLALIAEAVAATGPTGGYILDGFPRTLDQARHHAAPPIDVAVHLDVPDAVARARLVGGQRAGRSDDESDAVIERRLRRFREESEPLLDLYRRHGMLETVVADQPPDLVADALLRALDRRGVSTTATREGTDRPT